MVTIYVLLILWGDGQQPDKTHMVYESLRSCRLHMAEMVIEDNRPVKKATCKATKMKKGEPYKITDGLMFIPN